MNHSIPTKSPQKIEMPLIALVGPTNAGKSTLFNRLTGTYQAVTAREVSTTRDRIYGQVEWQGRQFTLVDTGGLVDQPSEFDKLILDQLARAVEEADIVLYVFDGRVGLTSADERYLNQLRNQKTVWLVANKIDAANVEQTLKDYHYLGFPFRSLSAATGRGVGDFLEELTNQWSASAVVTAAKPIVTLIGRPNVGKSSLLNALIKQERAVVSPVAGTTRDVVTAKLTLNGRDYLLADTAGVRRRGKITTGIEQFSVRRTLKAIQESTAILVLVDATEGTTRGDLHLLYYAHQLKKPVLVVFNKIDLLQGAGIPFHGHVSKFDQVLVSAKTGQSLRNITDWLTTNVNV